MSVQVKPIVAAIDHKPGCRGGRACKPEECKRHLGEGWWVHISVKRPDGQVLRERVQSPASGKANALRWGEQRAAHLLAHGKGEATAGIGAERTVAQLITEWLTKREEQGAPSLAQERTRLNEYVLPALGEVNVSELKSEHLEQLITGLQKRESRKGGVLAPRTIRSTYFLFKQVLRRLAQKAVLLEEGILPIKKDKDPKWRLGARFNRLEVEALISDVRVPLERRVAYAVEFLSGVRTGEASALKWIDYDALDEPLGRLRCYASWNTELGKVTETKTETPREIPVHPVLASVLAEWKLTGWAQVHGRAPKADDLILPSTKGGHRSVNYALKCFNRDLATLGLRKRRHYDSRRTFISLALDAGASKDVLRFITHPPPEGDAFDLYQTPSWPARCQQVLCIRMDPRRGAVIGIGQADQAPKAAEFGSGLVPSARTG
jgi:integrase